jgi:hypothetical protein
VHQLNRPDDSLHDPDALKPFYGNCMQLKYNSPDAKATPSGRPLGILIITFYSNIGLGRNWRHWKAKEKCCNIKFRTATRSVRTASVLTEIFARPDGPAEKSRITFRTSKRLPVWTAMTPVPTRMPQNAFWPHFWGSKAYKEDA